MAMEPSRGVAVVLLAAVCCLHGAQGTSPPYPPLPPPRPPVCPLSNPLTKINFVQNAHGRAQVVQYVTDIPRLTSFTIHYWFSLETTSKTHTLFNYASDSYAGSELLEVQLETNDEGRNQFWKVTIEGVETRVSAYPPIGQWQWYHALHSWDSSTGIISHYINGELLQSHYNYQTKGLVISPRGTARSGQTRRALFNNGVDQGEGLDGWLTLLQFSGKPIGVPTSSDTVAAKAERAYRCEDQEEGEFISWSKTPRKSFGGVTAFPTFKSVCGQF
ncbi:C-reactive protein 3.3-like [Portunus trituberculatus]|uniref:C-reactive protein 3.3-like n=1 Tax=Portunus trituberculatus TaxID=210409 RepID=UPI001E1CF4B2|nr:C-reactive protein 3.3-like [Portunus trituberculatus]